jgi:prepilin-type N-terminal cleavage/methylation domain-containing protein/prepilin-type processing-associated H-X9-DG protein
MASAPRSAFTLIELLVVIAIIAIMASLLMPAISMVKSIANTTKCASNLRQIHMGTLGFADDHRGELPPSYIYRTSGGADFFFAMVAPYIAAASKDSGKFADLTQASVLWGCPGYKKNASVLWACGYGMNYWPEGYKSGVKTNFLKLDSAGEPISNTYGTYKVFRFDSVTYQATRPMVGDSNTWEFVSFNPKNSPPRHRGKLNTVFYDGHVDGITYAQAFAALKAVKP